ncbi:type I-E CRISPR-associated endoribonuclease Cas2 [Cryobacterium frigoriphilum]|uniref:Type I-E CRISPR-associated endoribonuclease Cas2 n=1 Tax=Cryobacterium frigoriphilum TaxID=1259150 RepID=A0A4R8ZUF5_9MICO|nr:type I-E CRISPR-associated endoribonuclease Cas2e [Cryobacterium frigoriphilum]TFD45942.1 type I-E CRISPR-associated endoribonuclease Cas2 [Cryobacterium frigoriphilum]
MFTTLRITAVPDHLRGYLSRFLVEYGTGMYVGNVSKRVAESLWAKAVDAAADGEVVMVTSAPQTEQGFRVQLHQARGKDVIDFDGFSLMRSIPLIAHDEKGGSQP